MEQENKNPEQGSLVVDLQKQQLKERRNTKILISILLLIIVGAGFFFWKYKDKFLSQNSPRLETPVEVATSTEETATTSTPEQYSQDAYINQQCQNRLQPVLGSSGIVEWVKPEKNSNLHIFATINNATSSTEYLPQFQDFNYVVGHVKTGKYAGGDFIVSLIVPDGPSAGERYRIIKFENKYYYLSKYSNALPSADWGVKFATELIEDKTFDLPDLNFPEKITLENSSIELAYAPTMGFFQNGRDFFCADNKVKAFTDSKFGDVYIDNPELKEGVRPRNGFYIKAPDGTERVYELEISIIGKDMVPLVTWSNGTPNKDEYNFQAIGGCGASNFRDVVILKDSEIIQIGKTVEGQPIYGYADNNSQELKDFYEQTYFPEQTSKPSYTEFIASHPIFFWKDPFGSLIRFKNKKYQPLAECGKPVIYLYPETTQKISVKVFPAGGMSYSDPVYNTGWNVIADTNSNITNLATGKIYPYLFWEGRGGLYETPKKGFVVEKKNVHEFLVAKLNLLGLNSKETSDFIEYWEPKMQESPYYFVTFMDKSFMDTLAPLEITPKPDTIIRILIDYLPLKEPIKVTGYNIQTPKRQGFTVVEWGGVLR